MLQVNLVLYEYTKRKITFWNKAFALVTFNPSPNNPDSYAFDNGGLMMLQVMEA